MIPAQNPFYNRFETYANFDQWKHSEFGHFFGKGKSRAWMKNEVNLNFRLDSGGTVNITDFKTLYQYLTFKIESGTGLFFIHHNKIPIYF